VPQIIELTHREMELLTNYSEALRQAGFDVDVFDNTSAMLRGGTPGWKFR